MSTDARLERVMAEMAWVRQLARVLARDEGVADDVAQDAWLVAAERAPDDDAPLRPWLARVVHNLVRMRGRSGGRRRAREAIAPGPDGEATPHELLERVQAQRAVADEVIALAEPYRTAILMFYVDGVSSATIARRLDVPAGTVRRRLKVGRDQLRDRLRRGGRAGLVALLALASARHADAAPTLGTVGALTMKKLIAAMVVLAMLLIGGVLVVHHRRAPPATSPVVASTSTPRASSSAAPSAPLVLGPRHIAGRVEAAGRPVAGATVRLGAMLSLYSFSVEEPVATARTGADGRFDLGELARGAFEISAEAPGYTPAVLRVDRSTASDRLVLALGSCTSRLIGTVRDVGGGPIGRARLSGFGLGGADAAANGSFSLCLPASNTYLRVSADGYGTVGFDVSIAGELHHDVVLVPEAVLTGDVVDEAGHPVANARVLASWSNGPGGADESTVTDTSGAFHLARLTPGRYRVSATAEHGLGARVPAIVVATTGATNAPLHLVLAQRARVSGRVVDGNGLAVAGASITVDDRFDASAFATSQLDGSFTLVGVPLGSVALTAAPYEVRATHRLVVDKLVVEGVRLEVAAGRTVRGTVTRHGATIAGAEVTCGSEPVTTDATGHYVLSGLGLQCNLFATVDRAASAVQAVALAAGETRTVDIDIASSASIAGTVVDASGAPVSAVEVIARRPEHPSDGCTVMTGSAGDFDCSGLAGAADYEIAVYPGPGTRSFAPATGEHLPLVHLGGGDASAHVALAIALDRLAIRGTVVDDTGAPVPDAFVRANVGDVTYGNPTPTARTDGRGAFVVDNLGSGTYRVSATAVDGGEASALGVATGTTALVLRVARAGAITGDLVGFQMPPTVSYHQSSLAGDESGETVADGSTFTLSGLVPGTYRLEAWDDATNVEGDAATVVVHAGTTSHVTLRERGQGTISARVVDSVTGAPIAGLPCHVAAASDGNIGCCHWLFDTPPVLSDVQGHLTMSAPAGAARIFCMPALQPPFPPDAPYSWASADVQVPANGTGYAEVVAVPRNYPRNYVGFYTANFIAPPQIVSLDPGSPAAASGLAIGDIITTIDGQAITGLSPNAVMTLATNHRAGTLLSVGTLRGTFAFVVGAASLP